MTFGSPYGPDSDRPDEVEFPGPEQGRRHLRLMSLLGVAVVALAGGAGIAYAAGHGGTKPAAATSASQPGSASPSPSASASPKFGGPGRHGFGFFGAGLGGFGFGGLGGAIHGQLTEPKPGGGYQTLDIQSGTVTAVSSSSITVKSADGYTATYAVSSSTEVNAQAAGIATVKVGNSVELTATVAGGTATADSIIDLTSIGSSRGSFGFPGAPKRFFQSAPPKAGQN
jgi:hypothetical protein